MRELPFDRSKSIKIVMMSITWYKLCFCFLMVGCASISTDFNVSPGGEWDRYQTFYCLECQDDFNVTAPQYDNEENRELIRKMIRSELEKKGYFYLKEDPDLLIDFHITIEDKTELLHEAYPMGWQSKEFMTFPINYQYGTLIIHIVDRNTNQLVWEGIASEVLENSKKATKTIQRSITRIFKDYSYSAQR